MVLIGYIPKAGRDGVRVTCANGKVRHIHPILAAYIVDHPEQCLIACCKENCCPKCTVLPNNRGSSTLADLWTEEFVAVEVEVDEEEDEEVHDDDALFNVHRIRPVFKPFWESLSFTDIFLLITPNILHQLHKGIFKDHLVSWVTTILGKKDIDNCFSCIPDHLGLRHFKNGITSVSQWTGREHKEMQKVLLGILAGCVHRAGNTRSLQYSQIHSMVHYINCIRAFGSLDGYNNKISKCLHIDYAKKAYAASNKCNYHEQMTIWLCRQEAIVRQTAYLDWCSSSLIANTEGSDNEDSGSDSDWEEEDEPEQVDAPRIVDLASSRSVDCAYSLTKTPSRRMVSVCTIEEEFGVHDFIPSLNKFL
ncbi:hypothetical protein BT96DRAFT_952915 [Gymnopus androsaceus JB14]|uniref:CxC2-like cysteine cluster KDZ transposase-associated domain-containing protein n=1 Tax=Gymnopus androsaceus JB14 TaxID=1447944 RepID=A0A6A4IHX1_9AGAR|nr:hypothetical protein BT96DRAFT_952915 [Gymnopus androsaceus JB14]